VSWAKEQANGKGPKTTRTPGSNVGIFKSHKSLDRMGSLDDIPGFIGVVQAVAFAGDALTIGLTSDGGTWSITVLHDRQQEKAWPHTQEELNEVFCELAEHYLPVRKVPDPPPK